MRQPGAIAKRQAEMRAAAAGARKRGRPRLQLDPIEIFEWAQLGLSNRPIAAQLGCNHKTLHRFAADLERARLRRRTLLQLEQMQLIAEENSWAALKRQLKRTPAEGKSGAKQHPFGGEK